VTDAKLGDVTEETENFEEPDDQTDDDNGVQDSLDGALHWNESIHEPHQEAYEGYYDNNGYERHGSSSFTCWIWMMADA
jgi:hypothetical protein